MPSSISNSEFERPIPAQPWSKLLLIVAVVTAVVSAGWELRARAKGYAPTLNDTADLWADRREAVQPDSIVIIGDSRPFFDLDLDALQQGLGRRPIQLALAGSCCYPILQNLADDPKFHGTIICSVVPGMYLAPGGPLLENSNLALKRYRNRTVAQRASNQLGLFLEEHLACLKQEDLTLDQLIKRIEVPDRAGAMVPPKLPPYFCTVDRERRARMF
ncbi:MAG TPA: hypothetical protein VFJ90_00680, partial [Candidatus Didemnitutus sp.]|nr:hypothetical protein [Candidatus Didemnitutus sp.]